MRRVYDQKSLWRNRCWHRNLHQFDRRPFRDRRRCIRRLKCCQDFEPLAAPSNCGRSRYRQRFIRPLDDRRLFGNACSNRGELLLNCGSQLPFNFFSVRKRDEFEFACIVRFFGDNSARCVFYPRVWTNVPQRAATPVRNRIADTQAWLISSPRKSQLIPIPVGGHTYFHRMLDTKIALNELQRLDGQTCYYISHQIFICSLQEGGRGESIDGVFYT